MGANKSRTMRFFILLVCSIAVLGAAPAMAQNSGSAAAGYDESGVLNDVLSGGNPPSAYGNLPSNYDEQIPTTTGDNPPANNVNPTVDTGSGPNPARRTVEAGANLGSLPFTGLDVGIIALAGLALLGTGMVLRRTAGTTNF